MAVPTNDGPCPKSFTCRLQILVPDIGCYLGTLPSSSAVLKSVNENRYALWDIDSAEISASAVHLSYGALWV